MVLDADSNVQRLLVETLDELKKLRPDFVTAAPLHSIAATALLLCQVQRLPVLESHLALSLYHPKTSNCTRDALSLYL